MLRINVKLGGLNIGLEPNPQMRSIDMVPTTTSKNVGVYY